MAFSDGMSAADIAAVTGNNNSGFGNGDGSWWLLVLFLFAMMNGGWGNNGGGNGVNYYNQYNSDMQRGFDQQSVMNGINNLNTTVANGFSNAEVSRCNSQANILQTLNANQMSTQSGLADIRYAIASENCEDRSTVNNGVRDLMAAQTANTQAIINSQQQGFQSITDKLCQLELDGIKQRNADLLAENSALKFAQSQTAQTAQLQAANTEQTAQLLRALNPTPIPAYQVQNPNGYGCFPMNTCCGN